MYSIYIIEDDNKIRTELKNLLTRYGYSCVATDDFARAAADVLARRPHLVLLDINLPCFDGYHICREIRRASDVPIIMVTSRDSDADELMSMNLGADDFITKPYNTSILLARIAAILNRAYAATPANGMEYAGVRLDAAKSVVEYAKKQAELTKNELRILSELFSRGTEIVSRDELMDALWQTDSFVDDNTLSVNVNRLRKKLAALGLADFIKTRRGMGYSL